MEPVRFPNYNLSKKDRCSTNRGICFDSRNVPTKCLRLPYFCGRSAVCCRQRTKMGINKSNFKGNCKKTTKKCLLQGGKCMETSKCKRVAIDKLCKGSSCTCCLGHGSDKCDSSPCKVEEGGICMKNKYKAYCNAFSLFASDCEKKQVCCTQSVSDSECKCGQANEIRIIGGQEVSPKNKYPWMVGIMLTVPLYLCGGSLISDRYVLTAAHCFFLPPYYQPMDKNGIALVLGDHKQLSVNDDVVTKYLFIDKYIIHPNFTVNDPLKGYDIALIRLQKPIDITSYKQIKPVCLPPKTSSNSYEGFDGIIAGWGNTDPDDILSLSSTLQEITVPILDFDCWGFNFSDDKIGKDIMCAGYKEAGKAWCVGDSGGPLVVKEGIKYVQVGIASDIAVCAKPNSPGIFTRISSFLDWIEDKTKDSSFCSE